MKNNNRLLLVLASFWLVSLPGAQAANTATQGLTPPANTYRSFIDASLVRDSEIDNPLDLLNDFYPEVTVTVVDHDNVRRRSDVEEQDLRISINPSLAYRTNLGRHQFYAAYSGTFVYHDDLEQEDSTTHQLTANLGLDVSRRWDLNVFGGFGSAVEERGISGSRPFNQLVIGPDNGPDEVDFSFYGADLIYGREVSPLNAVLGFERYTSDYDNNVQGDGNLFGSRDRTSDSLHFDLSYQLGSRTAVFGRIEKTEIDYDRISNTLDSEETNYLIGLRWRPSTQLSGVVGFGAVDKDFDDPSRTDYDGNRYYANLNYSINPFSTISLGASRAVEEPGDNLSDFYVSDYLGIGWDHAFSSRWSFNAYAKWIEDDYNTDREDEFFDFGLGLDYVVRPWLTAGLFYGEAERRSNIPDNDYDDSYIGLRLRSDLRPLLRGRGSRVEPESFDYPEPSGR